jgi:hypothetical protein
VGSEQKLAMVEADDGHGYTRPRREAAYRWFGRWLKGAEDLDPEQPVTPESETTLNCTDTGQVATSLGGETVFTLNRKRVEQARAARARREELPDRVRQLTAFQPPSGDLNVRPYGRIRRSGYHIEKLTYESEPGLIVPALLYVPESPAGKKPAVVYVHSRGKSAAAGDAEQLARTGSIVLAIDARGWGETQFVSNEQGNDFPRVFGDYSSAMKALLIGRPLVGMRALDISRGIDLLAGRPDVDAGNISGFGKEGGGVPLLHLAVFDQRLKKIALEGMLLSYEATTAARIHRGIFETVIPGVLKSYDLPDLVAALAPRPVWLVNTADPVGHTAPAAEVEQNYARAREAFDRLSVKAQLQIRERRGDQPVHETYAGFVKDK